ncbi:MAG: hypothetical protein ACE5OZ_22185 [Candidatus Heimdallarchaeota archaeon]
MVIIPLVLLSIILIMASSESRVRSNINAATLDSGTGMILISGSQNNTFYVDSARAAINAPGGLDVPNLPPLAGIDLRLWDAAAQSWLHQDNSVVPGGGTATFILDVVALTTTGAVEVSLNTTHLDSLWGSINVSKDPSQTIQVVDMDGDPNIFGFNTSSTLGNTSQNETYYIDVTVPTPVSLPPSDPASTPPSDPASSPSSEPPPTQSGLPSQSSTDSEAAQNTQSTTTAPLPVIMVFIGLLFYMARSSRFKSNPKRALTVVMALSACLRLSNW